MVKPKSSNRSIRLPDEMWAWLIAESDRRQTSVNGLVGDLLMVARLRADEVSLLRSANPQTRPVFNEKPVPKTSGQRITGFTTSGEPIVAPAFVSRPKAPKGTKK